MVEACKLQHMARAARTGCAGCSLVEVQAARAAAPELPDAWAREEASERGVASRGRCCWLMLAWHLGLWAVQASCRAHPTLMIMLLPSTGALCGGSIESMCTRYLGTQRCKHDSMPGHPCQGLHLGGNAGFAEVLRAARCMASSALCVMSASLAWDADSSCRRSAAW